MIEYIALEILILAVLSTLICLWYKPRDDYYYSNCLLEAIIAKVSNWDNVTILCLPPDDTYDNPHWLWEENGVVYDFYTDEKMKYPWELLWWRGHIRTMSKDAFLRLRRRKQ